MKITFTNLRDNYIRGMLATIYKFKIFYFPISYKKSQRLKYKNTHCFIQMGNLVSNP
jgi:hypothetical protein